MMLNQSLLKKRLIICLLLLPLLAIADDADHLVQKMVSAMSDLNYQGTYVYSHNNRLETIKLKHINDNGAIKETLLSLTGEAREIIRNNDTVWCILPAKKAIIIDKARSQFTGINKLKFLSSNLKAHYVFRHIGEDRVAGHNAFVVHIDPNDDYRYAHTLWIDKSNSLLLKSSISDEKNIAIEQIIFTDITIIKASQLDAIKVSNKDGYKQLVTLKNNNTSSNLNTSKWSFTNIPPGYKFEQFFNKTMKKDNNKIKQWLFSDGLISYSIFVREVGDDYSMPDNMIKMGSVNVYSTHVDQYLITVMGEVPEKTIMMASSGITKQP